MAEPACVGFEGDGHFWATDGVLIVDLAGVQSVLGVGDGGST
jgi:hypothetical protein